MIFYTKSLCRQGTAIAKISLRMNPVFSRLSAVNQNKWIMRIKLMVVLLTSAILQVSASTYGQNVTLKHERVKLATVLNEIRKQSGVDFVYSDKIIALSKPVSINVANVSLEAALEECFRNQPVTFTIDHKMVTIIKRPAAVLRMDQLIIARLSGVVKDTDGNPLPGASIAIKGTTKHVITDAEGRFVLDGAQKGDIIVVTYIGFVSQEVVWNGEGQLNVKLASQEQGLDDVIVVAYGTAKKSTFTGSVAVISGEKLAKVPGSSFAESLQGMGSGVNVVNNEGNPGGNTRIQIRGISSMSGASKPLYVLDGMPYDGELNSISPSDIESISVLKDAAASSLYGSRASDGVVMITTKKGKSDIPKINFRSAWGTSDNAIGNPVKADPAQQLLYTWEGMYNDQFYKYGMTKADAGNWASNNVLGKILKAVTNSAGQSSYVSPFKHINENYVLHDGNGNPYLNPNLQMVWDPSDYDVNGAVYSRKLRQDYGLDVSGASSNGKTNYLISGSYLDDKGYASNQYFKRYTFRTNVTTQATDWLQLGGSIAYSSSRQNTSGSMRAHIFTTTMSSPWLRNIDNTDWVYSEKTGKRMFDYGSYVNNFFGIHPMNNGGDYWDNPNDEDFNNNQASLVSTRFFANVKLPFDLNFKSSLGIDNSSTKYFLYGSAVHGSGQMAPYGLTVLTSGGNATRSNADITSLTWNNILTWNKKFGDHSFSALAGQELYNYNYLYNTAYGEGIMQIGQYELSSTTRNWSNGSQKDRYGLFSFLGKVDYDFQNKYYLSSSIRSDGSSRFHPDNRWGYFYSVGASWRMSNENFIKDTEWINNLSLRASYGTNGNDKLTTRNADGSPGSETLYAYEGVYEDDPMYGNPGLRPSTIATPELRWESNKLLNVALDFNIFKTITGTVEYYTRNSSGLLYQKPLPLSAQAGAIIGKNTNLGNIRNSGFEVSLGAELIRSKDFGWRIDANISTLKNEVTYLPGGAFTFANRAATYKLEEGHSVYDFFMVKNAGVNPDNGNMRYLVKDGAGGWKTTENYAEVTTADYQYGGSALPKAYGSFTNSFDYGGFDLSIMFYYSLGGKMFDYGYIERTALRGGVGVIPDLVADRWKNPGDQAMFPKWSNDNYADTRRASDFYVFNNSYLRLRNLTLGFTLPKELSKKLGMTSARIYLTGNNLLTFGSAKNRYSDPETGVLGNNYNGNADTDNGVQGSRRIYMGGIQVSF